MTIASIIFGLIIATLAGALLHFWRGGSLGRLLYYIVVSWIGFWAGHIAGAALGWTFFSVGPLNLGSALLVDVIALAIGYWLGYMRPAPKTR